MQERVFLSKKQVLLSSSLSGTTPDEIAHALSERLKRPFTVKDKKGNKKTEVSELGHSVTSYGAMLLPDGRRGYVLSVSVIGTSVCGMYFFRAGENTLSEMVDPDRRKVDTVVYGEKL